MTSKSRTSRKKGGKSGLGAAFQRSLTVTLSLDYSMRSVSVSLAFIDSFPGLFVVWLDKPEAG